MRTLLLALALACLTACTLTVDKRVWVSNNIRTTNDVKTGFGSASVPSTVTVPSTTTNTSDTKTDATQAIEGALSLPIGP